MSREKVLIKGNEEGEGNRGTSGKWKGENEDDRKMDFYAVASIREDLSIDVSIIIIGLILTKLRWFQPFSTCQNSISNFFWKNFNFWVSML